MKIPITLTNDVVLQCEEITVNTYKQLLKVLKQPSLEEKEFYDFLYDVIGSPMSLQRELFNKLSILDVFCILLDIRLFTRDNVTKLLLTVGEKKATYHLDLNQVKQKMLEFGNSFSEVLGEPPLQVICGYPSIGCTSLQNTARHIKGAILTNADNHSQFVETSSEQAEILLDKLSPKTLISIQNSITNNHKEMIKFNFLDGDLTKGFWLGIPHTYELLRSFIDLIYTDSLSSMLDNIFYLSHHSNMNPSFIHTIPYEEYDYYVNRLILTLKSNKEESSDSNDIIYDDSDMETEESSNE